MIDQLASDIGQLTRPQLEQLAELLVYQHEGRAVQLNAYIAAWHEDKSRAASEEFE